MPELAKMISNDIEFIPPHDGKSAMTRADIGLAGIVLGWIPEMKPEDYFSSEKKA